VSLDDLQPVTSDVTS